MSLREMIELVRRRLLYVASSLENGRLLNVTDDLDTVTSMVVQLSQLTNVDEALDYLEAACDLYKCSETAANQQTVSPAVEPGSFGRPKFSIPIETLGFFLENNFKVKDMAALLGVSKRTVERRLHQFNLRVRDTYSSITDNELNEKVSCIVNDFPHIGYRTVHGMLMAQGHRVQEYRVRQAVQNTDPQGVLFRRLFLTTCRIQRRTYSVRGSQALWHIDGNHKLIRIERMWRELWNGVTVLFYNLFHFMEDTGLLQVENELHLQVLHLVFIPLIQNHLDRFRDAIQRRPLRTENQRTPLQLWLSGQIQETEPDIEITNYGIDVEEEAVVEINSVTVPDTPLIPEGLRTDLQPILSKESACFRMDIFEETVKYIQENM